jgi:hypothetical protein
MDRPYRSHSSSLRSLQDHQRHADVFFLVLTQVALVDAVDGGAFHQLTQQLDDGQDEFDEVALHRFGVDGKPLRHGAACRSAG